MTKPLKASGFLGLSTMMTVGLYQSILLAGGQGLPQWLISGHAHLGVLSILAIVMGFAVPALDVTGSLRTAVTGLFVAGQWGVPGTVWLAGGFGLGFLHPTSFLWGGGLITSMLIMFYVTVTHPGDTPADPPDVSPADD